MAMQAGERKSCEACGRAMIGAAHAKTGKIAPITVEPSPKGNVLVFRDAEGVVKYAIANQRVIEWTLEQGIPLRISHFADCPEADRFHRT